MRIIQDLLEKTLKNQFTLEKMGAKVIERRLEQLGVNLTEDQKTKLRAELSKGGIDNLSLSLNDSQITPEMLVKQTKDSSRVVLDIGDAEPVVNEIAEQFLAQFTKAIPDMASEIGGVITCDLNNKVKAMLRRRRPYTRKYESFITSRWGSAFDLLETMIVIATEAGEDFNEEVRREDSGNLIEATIRLYARACQVANEVLTLLKSGYADGAHARWRCLHEIAVVLFFLASSGEETAKRYLLHDRIESYKAARLYQEHCERLGYEPFTEKEMNQFKMDRDRLVAQFGKCFAEEYGWAETSIGIKRPCFRDIENQVELAHLRPFYKMASHNVHANPKGVIFKLGVFSDGPDVLLAGPSPLGLADPGQWTAISLLQATIALISIEPNMDRLVICDVMRRFSTETENAFMAVHQSIENEAATNK